MATGPRAARARPRKVDLNARVLHKGATAVEGLKRSVQAGEMTRAKLDFMTDLARRFLQGTNPTIQELLMRSEILRELTGLPLPIGSMIFANNRRFIPDDLHRAHVEDTRGLTTPTRWLQRMIDESEEGVTDATRRKYVDGALRMLRDYYGPEYRKLILDTMSTRRQREILSCEVARPDFRETFRPNPLRRMHGRIIMPGGHSVMQPRDPEALLRPLFDLDTAEMAHYIDGSSMRTEIREALKDLIQSGPADQLARHVMDIGAYRPTRINAAYIGHMKGVLFEVLMRERQLELLADFGQIYKSTGVPLLILGTQARLFDGKLKPSAAMSDGVISVLNPRPGGGKRPPTLDTRQIHELKSGFSGDIQAYVQTAKWTPRLAELAEMVIMANALVYRLDPFGNPVGPLPFSEILLREGVVSKFRDRLRSEGTEGLVPGAIDHAAWVFGQTAFDAHGGRFNRRPLRGKLMTDQVLDPVFLANSERRMAPEQDLLAELADIAEIDDPKLADRLRRMTPEEAQKLADKDLGGFFPDQVVAPEIMLNFVAEELEYAAIRILEVLTHRMYKGAPSGYLELTPQALGKR